MSTLSRCCSPVESGAGGWKGRGGGWGQGAGPGLGRASGVTLAAFKPACGGAGFSSNLPCVEACASSCLLMAFLVMPVKTSAHSLTANQPGC